MQEVLSAFSLWLSSTPLSETIKDHSTWVIPLAQTIHILGIAAIMGTIVFINLRVLGLTAHSQTLAGMTRRLMPAMWVAMVVLLLTGLVMVTSEPNRSIDNLMFQIKMLLVIVVLLLTTFLTRKLNADPDYWDANGGRKATARVVAVVSVFIWILIIFAGRWIAYYDPSLFGLS